MLGEGTIFHWVSAQYNRQLFMGTGSKWGMAINPKVKTSFLLKRNGPNDLNKMISKVYACKMGQGE